MKYQKYLAIAGACLLALHADAQKKHFTITEATNGMATTLAPKGLKQASWEPGTNKLYFAANDAWVYMNFPSRKTDTVLRLSEMNAIAGNKLKALPTFKWLDKGYAYYQDGNDLKKGTKTAAGYVWEQWATLPDNAENMVVDKSLNIAYTRDNNLYLYTKDKRTLTVTDDKDKNIINGQAVHRNEFGIDGGIFFSPQGNYLAYYHMDQTMVKDYPVINWLEIPAKNTNVKYPMAGGTSHEVQVRVFNPTTGNTVTIKTEGPKDQYFTSVSWSPDEQYIFIAVLNRDQDHMWLNKYSAKTGAFVKTLFEETSDKYVEPQHGITFLPNSNDEFLWWSQRDGYMHLYRYNTNGRLLNQVTKGKWIVNAVIGMNEAQQQVLIEATKESPMEKHSYAVNWNTGKLKRIDSEAGWHAAVPNESGEYVYDVFSAGGKVGMPATPVVINGKLTKTTPDKAVAPIVKRTQVIAVNADYDYVLVDAPNTLAAYDRPEIHNVTLTANDGTPLYGKLVLPVNFNEKKKYPVIVYLYNGPHVQLVKNSFPESGNLWYEYMAQRGYVVFCMDGRGSSNRGYKFESATFGQLGTVEMEDQMKGVSYLQSLSFVDSKRMGIHGWSFGGFMTTSFMLRKPDVFKVGVAGGPVMDWEMYEIMYTERYMNTPEQNPKGYEDANLLSKAKNLKGKLLLIHGTDDATVVWQHSIDFLKKTVDDNIQVDYFVYPGYEHNVRGKDRVHLMQKISDYFDLHLNP